MKQYLDIVKAVTEHGKYKKPVRVREDGGVDTLDNNTIGLPNVIFSHDMSNGFPLLTTKKMPIKTIAVELEGFIKGITDKKWYQDRKCKIWNEWANPVEVEKEFNRVYEEVPKKELQERLNDLGPIYGYQWRSFNKTYKTQDENDGDYSSYTDQLKTIADKLRENPTDRRMVCSAWNPNQINHMALPPCHFAWNVVIYGDELNLIWHQRSCDLMLGVPFNIASYALLLQLLANHAGLKPGNLTGTLNDCHIYLNQLAAAKEQITRSPHQLPTMNIKADNIFDWTHEDIELVDYVSYEKLDFGKVTV